MSLSGHDALRRQLAACFNELTLGCEEAERVDQIISSLKKTFYDGIRDLVRSWGTRSPISRLPTEILAMCIGYLPLRSRIVATHVSHVWRAAALAVPAVWAHIDVPPRRLCNLEQLVKLLLPRSGSHPVDLTLPTHALRDSTHWPLLRFVIDHFDHVRSFVWGAAIHRPMFSRPAPILESLDLPQGDGLPDTGFLGGQPGVLRTLRLRDLILPDRCPAVATVAELDVALPQSSQSQSHLSQLFVLFPRLRSLSLRSVLADHVAVLSGIRPGYPLSKLSLQTLHPNCDVFTLYDAWKTGRMETVCLGAPLASILAPHVADCVSRALHLTVSITVNADNFLKSALLDAVAAEGKKHSLDLSQGMSTEGGVAQLAEVLSAAQPSMAQLRSLEIPAAVFAALDVALPAALKMLTLVYAERLAQSRRGLVWPSHELELCIRRLLDQPVESLVLRVRSYSSAHPISVDELRAVLQELSPIAAPAKGGCVPEMRIRILGVPVGVTNQLASTLDELGISCEPEESGYPRV